MSSTRSTKFVAIAVVTATCGAGACGGKAEADANADGAGGSAPAAGGSGSGGAQGPGPSGGTSPGSGGDTSSGGDTALGGAGFGGAAVDLPPVRQGTPPSCQDFEGDECAGDDCCASLLVPGGTVPVTDAAEGEISLPSFYLDKYEVTVVRFRQYMDVVEEWIAAGNPQQGAGAHPLVPESGWRADWMTVDGEGESVAQLVPDWFGFPETTASVGVGSPTYPLPGSDELAVNYVTFHGAFAFCIWDGGRLPTRLEWLYAAHGGPEPSEFPWGDAPDLQTMFPALPAATVENPYQETNWEYLGIPVGSHPAAAGRLGHLDLIGGLREHVRDTYTYQETLINLVDDAYVPPPVIFGGTMNRLTMGAAWDGIISPVPWDEPRVWNGNVGSVDGFRCARDPED